MFEHIFFSTLLIASLSATPSMPPLQSQTISPMPSVIQQTFSKKDLLGFPKEKILQNNYYVAQTFNNCGPASLSMVFSYFGTTISQEELGEALRPYQNETGDNDDKSVTLEEMSEKAKEYGFIPFHRPNGNIELLKYFITHDIPVITRSWMDQDDDIGHYRIAKGFTDTTHELIFDDSYKDKNIRYSYETFMHLWSKFNYEYLVLVPKEKVAIAEIILGENLDEKAAWEKAAENAEERFEKNPDDSFAKLNASVAYYNLGEYEKSVKAFEVIETQLPFRTLWYQIEPIQAYDKLGNEEKVFALSDAILENENRAFSELYLMRGNIYKQRGDHSAAKSEFEQAVYYNNQLEEAKEALASVE